MRLYVGSLVLCSMAFGLEFGTMGNVSASMGGAGVALKHSSFGLYYNPALLSSDPRVKMGYSVGIGIKDHNLSKIATIDVQNMSQTAERLVKTFTGGNNGSSSTTAAAITNILQQALQAANNGSSGSSGSTQDLGQQLKDYMSKNNNNPTTLIQKVKDEVTKSNDLDNVSKSLLTNIADGINYSNLSFNGNGSSGGSTASSLLSSISISKGADSGLDKTIEDIATIQNVLKDNNLNLTSQNGVILQISSKTMNEKLGSLGVAYFASIYSSMSIKADPNKMRLIIGPGGGSNSSSGSSTTSNGVGSGYYELSLGDNGYTFKSSTSDDYNKYSLIASLEGGSDAHKLIATSFILSEIPIGYARTIYLKYGNLNVGVAGKLMNSISAQNQININKNTNFQKELSEFASFSNAISSNSVGVDAGILYEIDLPKFRYLTLGIVGKNLNTPTFESTLFPIAIKPQYRFGIGYNAKRLNIAFDADLVPNDLIAFSNVKQQSQMIGGGIGFDLSILDLRVGAMKDLRQDTGLILTGGANVLGFLDIALQASTNFTKIGGYSIPQYVNLRIGGSFSF